LKTGKHARETCFFNGQKDGLENQPKNGTRAKSGTDAIAGRFSGAKPTKTGGKIQNGAVFSAG